MKLPASLVALSKKPVAPMSISSLHRFATGMPPKKAVGMSRTFLAQQLPIRHARRAADLAQLPGDLPGADRLLERYASLVDSIESRGEGGGINEAVSFGHAMEEELVTLLGDVSFFESELRKLGSVLTNDVQRVMEFSHGHLIASRLLVGQHRFIADGAKEGGNDGENSSVVAALNVQDVVQLCQHTVEDCRAFCIEKNGEAPEVKVLGPDGAGGDRSLIVEGHLHFVLMELLKNSMRAVLDKWGSDILDAPPIEVRVASKGKELGVRVSDSGGGVPLERRPFVWDWFYSSVPYVEPTYTYSRSFGSPFTGFGVGLPMARTYARVAGGDVFFGVLPGYGTDAYITFNRHGSTIIDY